MAEVPRADADADGAAAVRAGPERPRLVLAALAFAAGVMNLGLVAVNVALPEIGRDFDASLTGMDLVAVAFALGMATSVLWFGAIGDRHGRKGLLLAGLALSIPAAVVAGLAPSLEVLAAARLAGGVAAGMTYPSSLALVAALWAPGPWRVRAVAAWSAIAGFFTVIAPLTAGILLERQAWESVVAFTAPLAAVALVVAWAVVPSHVNESSDPVDHAGGALSAVLIGAVVVAISLAPAPGRGQEVAVAGLIAVGALVCFVVRERRARHPVFDLRVARRRTFWVTAVGGTILLGSLLGAMYIGQLYLQNVLGYTTLQAGAAVLPMAVLVVAMAPVSARLVDGRGTRVTMVAGYLFLAGGFLAMFALWDGTTLYPVIGITFALVGTGVGLGAPPTYRALTATVPIRRAGMGSGTADLQRDLGGALMQSVYGAVLAGGFATSMAAAVAASPEAAQASATVQRALQLSYASALTVAHRYPEYATSIQEAARSALLEGGHLAHGVGLVLILGGVLVVALAYPGRDRERALLAAYHAEDAATDDAPTERPATLSPGGPTGGDMPASQAVGGSR